MRLTPEVYLVGGGPTFAFGLSSDPDCHVYLVDGGEELALIDCGMGDGDSLDRIVENIREEGLDPSRLRHLLLTHYHIDHAGGAAGLQERFDLITYAAWDAAEALRAGDEGATSLDVAKRAGFYRADYHFRPCRVDRELREGDRVRVGSLELEVYETPGHCNGHLSFLLRGRALAYLFAADAVFHGGRVVLQNIHDCSVTKSAESVAKLAALEFDALLPGHVAIALRDGRKHVEIAHDTFQHLFVPRSFM